MKFTISCLLTLEMLHLHIKFGQDWPSSNNGHRTTMDANP